MERILPESLRRQAVAYAIQLGNLRWVVTGMLMVFIVGTWTHIVFTPLVQQLALQKEGMHAPTGSQSDTQYTAYLQTTCASFEHAVSRHTATQPYATFIAVAQKHNLEIVSCAPANTVANNDTQCPYQHMQHQFACRGAYADILACVQEVYEQHHELRAWLQALEISPQRGMETQIVIESIATPLQHESVVRS